MAVLLRNRLKYALTYDECQKIVMQRLIKVDGKVRTDKTYPCGFMGKETAVFIYYDRERGGHLFVRLLFNPQQNANQCFLI